MEGNSLVESAVSREKQADKLSGFLRRINAYEYVQAVVDGRQDKPAFDKFKKFMIRINGIARDIPPAKRSSDGEDVRLVGFVDTVLVPRHEDKEDLLRYAYDNLDQVGDGEEKYLIPAVINASHLFNDGNGRTSRVIYQLLEKHDSKEDFEQEMRLALGEDGRWDCPDVSPGLIWSDVEKIILKKYGWVFGEKEYPPVNLGSIDAGIATAEVRELKKDHPNYDLADQCFDIAKNDVYYLVTAIHAVLGEREISGMFTEKYEVKRLSPLKMADLLSRQQWKNILDYYFKLKKEHVKTIIDSFLEPDKYKSYHNKDQNLKDYFIENVRENYEKNRV